MCSQELNTVIEAIQPVITRVKPGDEGSVDIYDLRQTVKEQLEMELQTQISSLYLSNTEEDQQLVE